jgi:hypothetical protein
MVTQRLSTLLLLFAFAGCVPVPKRFAKADVLGTYEIQYPFGTETLVLSEDTYEQWFVDKSGKVFTVAGKWTFKSTKRSGQGALENAMSLDNGFGRFRSTTPFKGLRILSFAWYGGTVISLNEDQGFRMRKIR